jgi:acyl CoA:acetate/3-ketoacid CoA transferase beta subunit
MIFARTNQPMLAVFEMKSGGGLDLIGLLPDANVEDIRAKTGRPSTGR